VLSLVVHLSRIANMAETLANPLLSTKPSDSNLSASIHPLVLLTVSDQITRHQVRQQKGPIVGALLGQLHGRLVTAEYAFPCKVLEDTEGQWLLDQEWMEDRIQQCEYKTAAEGVWYGTDML
jgi:COP9 signalosome complex subunit 6